MSTKLEKITKTKIPIEKELRSTSCKVHLEFIQHRNQSKKKKIILNVHKRVQNINNEYEYRLKLKRHSIWEKNPNSQNLLKCLERKTKTLSSVLKNQDSKEADIKKLLQEICNNHKEMIKILENILVKNSITQQKSVTLQKNKDEQSNGLLDLQLTKIISSLKKQNSQVSSMSQELFNNLCSAIENKNEIKMRQISRISNLCEGNSIIGNLFCSPLANRIFSQSASPNNLQNEKIELRQLISRRFHAFSLNYSFFLEMLLQMSKQFLAKDQLQLILKKYPFKLEQNQIELVECVLELSRAQKNMYQVSEVAQKMRYFIEDRSLESKIVIRKRMHEFRSMMKQKSNEIQQKMRHMSEESEFLRMDTLIRILTDFIEEKNQMEYIISKLCVQSKNINQIQYLKLFDLEWVDGLCK